VLASSVVVVVCCFLPWAEVSVGAVNISKNGVERGSTDGWVFIPAALLTGVLGAIAAVRRSLGLYLTSAVVGLLMVAGAVFEIADVADRVIRVSGEASAHVGGGLFGLIVGAAGVALFGFIGAGARR
jgi:hypothetical protein